jgi:predicted alpha/beta-hydrolase family hydrolase
MLFFAGTRDTLCDLDLLKNVLGRLSAPWELETIEGADHSFALPKSFGMAAEDVYEKIMKKTDSWLSRAL